MSTFRREIGEQPEVAARLLAAGRQPVAEAARALAARRPAGLLIAARGSSDHAATYAKYLFEIRNRLPVALAAPSAFGLYASPPRVKPFCVLAVSQSGASPDICRVVEEAREQGSLTIVITNQPRSRLGRAAEIVLDMQAGPERGIPASKTYIASLLAFAMLSEALSPDPDFAAGLARVPEALRTALEVEPHLERPAAALGIGRMAVLGRGYHLATAEEVALKITETSYSVAEAQSVADFMHGPIAAVESGFPVLLIEADGPTLRQMRALGRDLRERGARLLRLTDRTDGRDPLAVAVTTGLPESLTPLPFAVAGQLLALRRTLDKGLDPDRPRGLQKVTETL